MGHIVMNIFNGYEVTKSSGLIDDSAGEPGLLCKPGRQVPLVEEKDPVYPKRDLPPRDKNRKRKPIKDVAEFAWECTQYIDRHGQILSRHGNPMSSSLEMQGKNDEVDSKFHAYAHCQGNGSWQIKIWQKLKNKKKGLVLSASGNFMTRPFNVQVHKYIPGDWEMNFYE